MADNSLLRAPISLSQMEGIWGRDQVSRFQAGWISLYVPAPRYAEEAISDQIQCILAEWGMSTSGTRRISLRGTGLPRGVWSYFNLGYMKPNEPHLNLKIHPALKRGLDQMTSLLVWSALWDYETHMFLQSTLTGKLCWRGEEQSGAAEDTKLKLKLCVSGRAWLGDHSFKKINPRF